MEQRIIAHIDKRIKTAPATETVPGRSQERQRGIDKNFRIAGPYDNLNVMDLGFLKSVMDAAHIVQHKGPWVPQNPHAYTAAFIHQIEDEKVPLTPELAVKFSALKADFAVKSDEVAYSTLAGGGDEWVAEEWRRELWRRPRSENPVFANSTVIEMPTNPYKLPIESTDPTVYGVAETKNENQLTLADSNSPIPDSKPGTSNGTMTAAKLALRVGIAEELNEDAIIPAITLFREQSVRAMEDARDAVILSADATTGTSNINYEGSSATLSVAAVSRFLYGGGDGYLHLPLVDNADPTTGMRVSMGGVAPTLAKIREARGRLNRNIQQRRPELVYYCDPETLLMLESLDEAIVTTINGVGSTFEGREVKAIDGIPVFPTSEMSLAQATGFVSATAASNTLGRLLLVHKPSWFVGFRREMRVTLDYLHYLDAHILVVSMRMALIRQNTDVASLLYNIAV